MDSTQGTQEFKEKVSPTPNPYHSFYPRCIIFGSYMLWMIITLTMSFIFCRRIFDHGEKKAKHLQEKEG